MNAFAPSVTVQDVPSVALGTYLQHKGYVITNSIGTAITAAVETSTIGILLPASKETSALAALWGFFWGGPRREYVGEIELRGDSIRINAYGRGHLPSLTILAEEISDLMKVPVDVRLVSERPAYERLWTDD